MLVAFARTDTLYFPFATTGDRERVYVPFSCLSFTVLHVPIQKGNDHLASPCSILWLNSAWRAVDDLTGQKQKANKNPLASSQASKREMPCLSKCGPQSGKERRRSESLLSGSDSVCPGEYKAAVSGNPKGKISQMAGRRTGLPYSNGLL
jgi:hypothetical protein